MYSNERVKIILNQREFQIRFKEKFLTLDIFAKRLLCCLLGSWHNHCIMIFPYRAYWTHAEEEGTF